MPETINLNTTFYFTILRICAHATIATSPPAASPPEPPLAGSAAAIIPMALCGCVLASLLAATTLPASLMVG